MQTFLPYESFEESFRCLDYRRLGKQRSEAKQILKTIKTGTGWKYHPAVKMWVGYEEALKHYMNLCIKEWINRGYLNTMEIVEVGEIVYPWWLGVEDFHRAMRSRLIEKNKDFYLSKFPNDLRFNNGLYLWPDNDTKKFNIINNEVKKR